MQLSTLQTFVRNLIFEPAGDTGLVDDTQLQEFINVANEMTWAEIVEKKASVFFTRTSSDVTITAASGIAYSTIDAVNGVFAIAQVEQNIAGQYITMEPLGSPQDRGIYEPSFPPIPINSKLFRFYIEKETLRLAPTPAIDIPARVTYVPGLIDMSSASDKPLQGRLTNFHRLVGYEAACLIFGKDEAAPGLIIAARDRLRRSLARHLSSMTLYKQRSIHHVPYT